MKCPPEAAAVIDRFCPLGYLMFASCATALVWVCALLKALPTP